MPTYVEIAVNVPQVAGVFHYHLPPELEGQVSVGHLVAVPFGSQTVQGVVLRILDRPQVAETRPVLYLIDPEAVLTAEQITLAQVLAQENLAPLALCIDLMLPPGLAQHADVIYSLVPEAQVEGAAVSGTQKRLLDLLHKRGPLRSAQIDQALQRVNWRPAAQSLKRKGLIVTRSVLPPPRVQPKVVRTAQLARPPQIVEQAMDSLGQPLRVASLKATAVGAVESLDLGRPDTQAYARRRAVITFLQQRAEPVEAADIYAQTGANLADLQRLEALGLITLGEQPSPAIKRRQAILRYLMQEAGPVNVSWLYAESGGSFADLEVLAERGLVTLGESEVWRDPLQDLDVQPTEPPPLTRDQEKAWAVIREVICSAQNGKPVEPILLHGVTGSGKTEIYLRAVDEVLRTGRQAIILVPEISLTPQTVRRFAARFPGQVGLVHSGLSPGERYDTWRRARSGDIDVVVGPRSALFMPLPRLGLIILDECHDDSYYQSEAAPHYHAREAAIAYARLAGAVCLLGSATPDVDNLYRALRQKWHYISLPNRILAHHQVVETQLGRVAAGRAEPSSFRPFEGQADSTDLPEVHVVDMRQELQAGNRSIFSRLLQERLKAVLDQGHQAIMFLNRRGTATYVFCRDCGESLKCPNCDIPLTYHSPESALICHRCNYRRRMPQVCPHCKSQRIRQYGAGTARLESEVQNMFPQARVLRWDAETTRQKGAHEIILGHFVAHRADILVGTQMVAKGLDLPLVTLVGVVLADVGLNLPDYRAAERTFQVLTQVAGRAGRSVLGGQVVLQTFQPDHYAVQAAARHDYRAFYEQELRYRRELGYPPFTRLVRLEYRHYNAEQAEETARAMGAQIRKWIAEEGRRATQIIGPAPCFLARVGGVYRWQIVLRGPDPVSLLRGRPLNGWNIEVNPPDLL